MGGLAVEPLLRDSTNVFRQLGEVEHLREVL
jgi:hypothetical protein